jgi:hypothetical protein
MAGRNDVLLTAGDLLRMREEDKRLDDQIRQLQQRRNENKRKLDAAEVFAESLSDVSAIEQLTVPDSSESGDSIPKALYENLRQTGDALNIRQIKTRLIELGFGERVKAQPNYHYATTYRLTKRGKLLRRGQKYRAAPQSSSQEETEAVGASVDHESHTRESAEGPGEGLERGMGNMTT